MFGALKKRLKGGDSQPASPAAPADVEPVPSKLSVTHHMSHKLSCCKKIAWDATRKVLAVATPQVVWVIGQGWCHRRFKLSDEEGEIVSLEMMVDKPSCVVCTSSAVVVLDYDTGLSNTCVAIPDQFTFTSATTPVAQTWTLVGRSDGVVQGVDVSASQTALKFDLKDIPHAVVDPEAPTNITHILSRMFHRQIAIVYSKQCGICQINFARKELMGRFTIPDETELTSLSMCAIDKYLLAGLSDGRVVVWKANDEPKNKKTHVVARMMIVYAMLPSPVTGIECYGSGTEDILFCRWMAGGGIIDAKLKPKEKSPKDITLNCIYEDSSLRFTGELCGMVCSSWPERTEPPSSMFLPTGDLLYSLSYSPTTATWNNVCVSQLVIPRPITSAVLVPSFIPNLLSHSPRLNAFPWNAGGKSDFAGDLSNAHLVIGSDAHGSLTAAKALLSSDAICHQALQVFDDLNATVGEDSVGGVSEAIQGNALVACSGGRLHWIDMITLNSLPIDTNGEKARCAHYVGAPLNRFFVGTMDGQVMVISPSCEPISISVSDTPVTSVATVQIDDKWAVCAVFVNLEGGTELTVICFDPDALVEAMEQPEEPLQMYADPADETMQVDLPPRPLRTMGRFVICGGEEGTAEPELYSLTKASGHAQPDVAPVLKSLKTEKQLPFNAGCMQKGVCLPPAAEICIAIRLGVNAFENTSEIKLSLKESTGCEALAIVVRKLESGNAQLFITWRDEAFKAEPVTLQQAEATEILLKEDEDNILCVRITPDESEVATLSSVDAACVPTSQQLGKAMVRMAAGDVVNGGPMWSMLESVDIDITSNEDSYRKQAVLSATCEPKGTVKMLQIFEDIGDPDSSTVPIVNVVPEDSECAPFIPMLSEDHTPSVLLVKSKGGVLRQVSLSAHKQLIKVTLTSPLRMNGKTVLADKVAVAAVGSGGPCGVVVSGDVLQIVQLPIPANDAPPLLSYSSESLKDMCLLVKSSGASVHMLGIGGPGEMLHLIISEDEDVEVKCDILDENEDLAGPFATLPKLSARPQVKAPGMGAMTMKSMFRNHPKEVQMIDALIEEVVEESFTDFASRILPEEQHTRLEHELVQERQQHDAPKKNATSSAVSDVKDQMNKNKELLLERGEKISELEENTRGLQRESEDFVSALKAYNEKQKNKKWWQL
eukprot:TRINITY_DN8085_c0_g1_i2.p1 TRINITY_DN8085_c0_g1~~TRINITY_DN8085_c0_g1_i2.p1  ORF type:complete len:1169 (+),score=186.03 TRINITY_DN8085_c0_g1_i2:1676-5182(+)